MTVSPATDADQPAASASEPDLHRSGPIRPERATTEIRRSFQRGREQPRGVVWFGVRSFWGHLRHFIAAAIATEDIDSRDWMTPDEPRTLVGRASDVLGGQRDAETLVTCGSISSPTPATTYRSAAPSPIWS